MRNFYTGQKVKIVGCEHPDMKHHVGKEGVIMGRSIAYGASYYVDTALRGAKGKRCSWAAKDLVPLNPPHEACDPEFSESLNDIVNRHGVDA